MAAKQIKDAETAARIAAIDIITDLQVINKMTNTTLNMQLEAHRQRDKEVPIKAQLGRKDLKLAALLAAVARYCPERNTPAPYEPMSNSDN